MAHASFLLTTVAAAAVPIQSKASHELAQRGLSHGYADSPIRGSVIGGQHKRNFKESDELIVRLRSEELADLVRRNPEPFLFGLIAKGIGALVNKIKHKKKRDLSELEDLDLISRAEHEELAALMARNPEPFLPLLGLRLAAGLLGHHHKRGLSSVDYEDALEREFEIREVEEIEDLERREYDEDEMVVRGWSEIEEID